MDIKIIGEHLTITDAIRTYIKEKFLNIPQPEKLNQAEFRLGTEKNKQYIHFLAHIHNENIVIKDQDENLYAAIDKIMKKINRSYIKAKEKHNINLYKKT